MDDVQDLGGLAPAWNEVLLTVVPVLAVLALALLVGYHLVPGVRDVADDVVVEGATVAHLDQALFDQLRSMRRLSLVESLPGSFTVVRERVPGWAIAVAVLAFPIGLLALMARTRHSIQVSVVDVPQGCRIRVVGSAPKRDIDAVAAAIQLAVPDRRVIV